MKILISILIVILIPTVAHAQCDGIEVVQEGAILVLDHGLDYNCGVTEIQHTVALSGDTLRVAEYAIAEGWMDCICPYRSQLSVTGLAVGDYVLEWGYGQMEPGQEPEFWLVCEMSVSMADPAGAGELALTTETDGCGIVVVGVPDPVTPEPQQASSWSALKARFHQSVAAGL